MHVRLRLIQKLQYLQRFRLVFCSYVNHISIFSLPAKNLKESLEISPARRRCNICTYDPETRSSATGARNSRSPCFSGGPSLSMRERWNWNCKSRPGRRTGAPKNTRHSWTSSRHRGVTRPETDRFPALSNSYQTARASGARSLTVWHQMSTNNHINTWVTDTLRLPLRDRSDAPVN